MQPREAVQLVTYLHELYSERFPQLSPAMTKVWYEDLRRMDYALMEQAVNRWVRQHTLKSPSLDELLEQAEFMQEEQRRQRRPSPRDVSPAAVLRAAAETQAQNPLTSDEQASYGHLMAVLGERSCGLWLDEQGVWQPKLSMEQRGAQCYEWANAYVVSRPKLAEELRHAARLYARIMTAEVG